MQKQKTYSKGPWAERKNEERYHYSLTSFSNDIITNKKIEEDTSTPEELIALIEAKQKEIDIAIRELKK